MMYLKRRLFRATVQALPHKENIHDIVPGLREKVSSSTVDESVISVWLFKVFELPKPNGSRLSVDVCTRCIPFPVRRPHLLGNLSHRRVVLGSDSLQDGANN
jgi:hypothetical protein